MATVLKTRHALIAIEFIDGRKVWIVTCRNVVRNLSLVVPFVTIGQSAKKISLNIS